MTSRRRRAPTHDTGHDLSSDEYDNVEDEYGYHKGECYWDENNDAFYEGYAGTHKAKARPKSKRSVSFLQGDVADAIDVPDIDAHIRTAYRTPHRTQGGDNTNFKSTTDEKPKSHGTKRNSGNKKGGTKGDNTGDNNSIYKSQQQAHVDEFCEVRTIRDSEPELFAVARQYSRSRVLRDIYNVDTEVCVLLRRIMRSYVRDGDDEDNQSYPPPQLMFNIGRLQRYELDNNTIGDQYLLQKQAKKRHVATTGATSKPTAKSTSVVAQDLVYQVGPRGAKYVIDHQGKRRYLTEMRVGNVNGVYDTTSRRRRYGHATKDEGEAEANRKQSQRK